MAYKVVPGGWIFVSVLADETVEVRHANCLGRSLANSRYRDHGKLVVAAWPSSPERYLRATAAAGIDVALGQPMPTWNAVPLFRQPEIHPDAAVIAYHHAAKIGAELRETLCAAWLDEGGVLPEGLAEAARPEPATVRLRAVPVRNNREHGEEEDGWTSTGGGPGLFQNSRFARELGMSRDSYLKVREMIDAWDGGVHIVEFSE